jgi:hypothetical protein
LPPLVPDALELLKARIQFDLTGKNAEKRMGYASLGVTVACVIAAYRAGGESADFVAAACAWVILMVIFGIGLLVTRRRNAKFARRLQAAGFTPLTDETGRLRYVPPGMQLPGQSNLFANGPYGQVQPAGAPAGYGQQAPGPYAAQPQPYWYPQQAPGPYSPPQAPGPYAPQQPYLQQQNPNWQSPQL